MRLYLLCCFMIFCIPFSYSQGHQDVFPALSGDALLSAVQSNFKPRQVFDYDRARDSMFGSIYLVNDSVQGIYSGWPVYIRPGADPSSAAFQDGEGLNTEHTWPRSNGADNFPARADLHHLFPSRADVNQARGNLRFREISDSQTDRWYTQDVRRTTPPNINRDSYSEYWANRGFEPRESVKGNIARAMFYFYTIYRAEANANAPDFFSLQQAELCDWHAADPVDEDEWRRTFHIGRLQDDKQNPFVLDCTLAARMYCPGLLSTACITTSTDDIDSPNWELKAYPNPSPANTLIKANLPAAGQLSLQLYDTQGRLVQTSSQTVQEGNQQWMVELPAAGMWYCILQLDTDVNLYRQQLKLVRIE